MWPLNPDVWELLHTCLYLGGGAGHSAWVLWPKVASLHTDNTDIYGYFTLHKRPGFGEKTRVRTKEQAQTQG